MPGVRLVEGRAGWLSPYTGYSLLWIVIVMVSGEPMV